MAVQDAWILVKGGATVMTTVQPGLVMAAPPNDTVPVGAVVNRTVGPAAATPTGVPTAAGKLPAAQAFFHPSQVICLYNSPSS